MTRRGQEGPGQGPLVSGSKPGSAPMIVKKRKSRLKLPARGPRASLHGAGVKPRQRAPALALTRAPHPLRLGETPSESSPLLDQAGLASWAGAPVPWSWWDTSHLACWSLASALLPVPLLAIIGLGIFSETSFSQAWVYREGSMRLSWSLSLQPKIA